MLLLKDGLQRALPDHVVEMEVTLIVPYPMNPGMRFVVRDGHATVGVGTITAVIA